MCFIKKKYVFLLWIVGVAFILFLNLGILINKFFLVLSLATVVLYTFISINTLKCPYCGGKENLERITFAINHLYYCRHCGKNIEVK